MKKLLLSIPLLVVMSLVLVSPVMADTIKDGTIQDSVGNTVKLGFDEFGYNYQAHIFNGLYSNFDRVVGGDFSDVRLQMKWNDAWLSNKDLDGDHKLDRHYGFASYIGSGAWLTNHDAGVDADGKQWTYFVKIVAVPADAVKIDGTWYADDTEIGPDIWGEFAVIQQVVTGNPPADFIEYDDWFMPGNYISPSSPALGNYR